LHVLLALRNSLQLRPSSVKAEPTISHVCSVYSCSAHVFYSTTATDIGSPLAQFREANKSTTPAERARSLESFTAIHDLYKKTAQEGNASNANGSFHGHHFYLLLCTVDIRWSCQSLLCTLRLHSPIEPSDCTVRLHPPTAPSDCSLRVCVRK
jgi:hypothetical protein